MRIGHCQIEVEAGNIPANLKKIEVWLSRASRDRLDIVSFPECSITGYPDNEAMARQSACTIAGAPIIKFLDLSTNFAGVVIAGFNEIRGPHLFNTAVIAHRGHILGHYSKCAAYMKFHQQGREFPVFEHLGTKFGVIICADGGYIEPARILALKGARIIFAPHFNYISKEYLLQHYRQVRADHTARAIENRVFFVRGNNVVAGRDRGITHYDGVGYGDSYILDPFGQIISATRLHREEMIFADIEIPPRDTAWNGLGNSLWSYQEFGAALSAAAGERMKEIKDRPQTK